MITTDTILRHKEVAGGRPRAAVHKQRIAWPAGWLDDLPLGLFLMLTQRDSRQVRWAQKMFEADSRKG